MTPTDRELKSEMEERELIAYALISLMVGGIIWFGIGFIARQRARKLRQRGLGKSR
jgi:hypothetical protein